MTRVTDFLFALGEKWQSWAALIALCIVLEAGALYYQIALMYYPCEQCIYTRVWIAGIALAAVAGLVLRRNAWALRAILVLQILMTLGLGKVVYKLLAIEYGFAEFGGCNLYAQFPSWAPLDAWFPTMFQVQDVCGDTPEVLFGLSMADGLAGVTIGLLAAFTLALVGSFRRPAD